MKIAFIWQGLKGRYGKWEDGLYAALKILGKEHEVRYFDFPLTTLEKFNPDVVLYWEAPVTQRGKDAENWQAVCALPYKKCLLFAGGPLKSFDVKDFDLVFVESQINVDDCDREGIPYKRAFGVNTQIFKPSPLPEKKKYDAFLQATFAEWKRHALFAQAVGSRGAVAGRRQEHDMNGYLACVKSGVHIFEEQSAREIRQLINQSYCVLNTSEFWGGGQRATLEAMACAVPVIVMEDSPKNCEFVRQSGGGIISLPTKESVQEAIEHCKLTNDMGIKGYEYVQNYWTEFDYARDLLEGIKSI